MAAALAQVLAVAVGHLLRVALQGSLEAVVKQMGWGLGLGWLQQQQQHEAVPC
jgi:hypothetical protein